VSAPYFAFYDAVDSPNNFSNSGRIEASLVAWDLSGMAWTERYIRAQTDEIPQVEGLMR